MQNLCEQCRQRFRAAEKRYTCLHEQHCQTEWLGVGGGRDAEKGCVRLGGRGGDGSRGLGGVDAGEGGEEEGVSGGSEVACMMLGSNSFSFGGKG